jgi:elongation factor Tu
LLVPSARLVVYGPSMAFFRRKDPDSESLDPQVLLAQADAAGPSSPGLKLDKTGFRMPVEDVFVIKGRGTVLTGRVESGTVTLGPARLTRTDGSSRDIEIAGIEMFRKIVESAATGDNVGLLVRGTGRGDFGRGDFGRDDAGRGDVVSG